MSRGRGKDEKGDRFGLAASPESEARENVETYTPKQIRSAARQAMARGWCETRFRGGPNSKVRKLADVGFVAGMLVEREQCEKLLEIIRSASNNLMSIDDTDSYENAGDLGVKLVRAVIDELDEARRVYENYARLMEVASEPGG